MPWDRFVLGYHGCEHSVVQDVVGGRKRIRVSKNEYDWLGHGTYFWEDSYARALQWAKDDDRIRTPAVLGAVINLGECLNLLDVEYLHLVRGAYEHFKQACAAAGSAMPVNSGPELKSRKLDCAVIENLHQIHEDRKLTPFDTVRGFFVEGKPIYPGAGLRHQDHIQLCVRNESNIIGYFLPRNENHKRIR